MGTVTPEKLAGGLRAGNIKPVYFLGGEEIYRKKQIIAQLKKLISPDDFNYFSCDGDKTPSQEILSLAQTPPVFANERLIVINRAEKIKLKDKKSLIEYLGNPLGTTCLVLVSEERKKTDALLKACEEAGEAAVFYGLRENEAHSWVMARAEKAGLSITAQGAKLLVDSAGTDLTALSMEIDKLAIYLSGTAGLITPELVLESLGFSKEENPYELASLIMRRDQKGAMSLIDRLIESGSTPVQLLNIITGTLVKLIKVKRLETAGLDQQSIAAQAGLNFFERDFVAQARDFAPAAALTDALARSLEYDRDLKTSSGSEPGVTLKSLVFKILSGGRAKRS
ncbi:MAG: DNA polymerase III subunit delta [Elusimicrobiaceae bacterium]|nr:DNA polymerase III subunit delta [Elusimicrobiaceae bacterium]